jgi:drug/metabolite transporter (DMT)-like permease
MLFLGEIAALGTSLMFSIAPTFFTLSGRLVGSATVNRTRLVMATVILILVHLLLFGQWLPLDAALDRWWWLGLSGVIGLTLGDAALFQAFVQIGARRTMLIFSLSPVLGAFMAWQWLGESLSSIEMLGIAVTIAGVIWVISEKPDQSNTKIDRRLFMSGLFFAFLGALGQASGLVTAKLGLYGDFSALSGLVIRMLIGTLAIWFLPVVRGQIGNTIQAFREKPLAFRYISIAVIFGPVIGVYLSLLAVQLAPIGVASTLMALPPIFLIPIDHFFFKERATLRSVLGTVVALGGVGILFLV